MKLYRVFLWFRLPWARVQPTPTRCAQFAVIAENEDGALTQGLVALRTVQPGAVIASDDHDDAPMVAVEEVPLGFVEID